MQSDKTDSDEVLRLGLAADFEIMPSGEHLGIIMTEPLEVGDFIPMTLKITKLIELAKAKEQDAIAALINDDAAAISYQSLAQYRSALLREIRARKDT